jgi:hypothetical protein
MFTTHRIAKGFAAALVFTLIGSAPALAKPIQSSAAPIEYLQYDLTPYFNSMIDTSLTFQYWRPNSGLEFSYRGLFDYAPNAIVPASPLVEASPVATNGVPYLGYDLTRYYNLAPGCPSIHLSDDLAHIC